MRIKPIALALLLAISATNAVKAQIQAGSSETLRKAGKLSKKDLQTLKGTTTIFTLRSDDAAQKADFEKTIGSVWKITPFKVVTPNELKPYLTNKSYSVCSFNFVTVVVKSSNMGTGGAAFSAPHTMATSTYFTYDLRLPGQTKKNGKFKNGKLMGRFIVMPDATTVGKELMPAYTGGLTKKNSAKAVNALHTKTAYNNWGPGMIKGYLKTLNDMLTKKETNHFRSEYTDDNIGSMANDTLYIPSYVNNRYSGFIGERSHENSTEPDDDIAKVYPYPVKYLKPEDLDQKILTATEPFHYLTFTRSGCDKNISVFSSAGNLVYAEYTAISYNFKNKDLRKLAKAIRKS